MNYKKAFLGVGIFLFIFVAPIVMVSNPMMDTYQRRIDADPGTDTNKWLQLTMAGICFKTGREERAAIGYGHYVKRFPEDEERPFAMMRYARSLEKVKRYDAAISQYEQFMAEYPDHEDYDDAKDSIKRIRYTIPH